MKNEILKQFFERYGRLEAIKDDITGAYEMLENSYLSGNKLLVAGNGGSASDASHIAGELMKSFRLRRKIDAEFAEKLIRTDARRGEKLACVLEKPLRAISLTDMDALSTAYINDADAAALYAQKLSGLGDKGDVFLGITTSGNSENVILAAITAVAMGLKVIALTGANGGEIEKYADITVKVPETETFMVQELHLPVYHLWCQLLEDRFFG